jgi:hypothetical protein
MEARTERFADEALGGVWVTHTRLSPSKHEEHEPHAPSPGPAADNIRAIIELERRAMAASSWSARVSDAISRFAGTLWFVLCHLAAFSGWAMWSALGREHLRFDPYPRTSSSSTSILQGHYSDRRAMIGSTRVARRAGT